MILLIQLKVILFIDAKTFIGVQVVVIQKISYIVILVEIVNIY